MLKKRGRLHRHLIIVGSAGGSIADLVRGLWHSDSGRRWLVPLAIFLCIIGMIFTMVASVEALAPFVYSIF
jgi:uncharacterized protein DUF5989